MNEDLKTMDIKYMKERLDRIERELIQLRKMTISIYGKTIDSDKTQKAWGEFMEITDEISDCWEGLSAVDEVKFQREK